MHLPSTQFPLSILANSLPALPEGPSLDNVRGPIEAGPGIELWQVLLAVLFVAILAGALIWFLLRSRQDSPPPLTAKENALAELEAAKATGEDEPFARHCADTVREYLGRRFNITSSSMTSAELYKQLPEHLPARESIRSYLQRCDGVKFAGEQLSAEDRIQILDTGRIIILNEGRKEPPLP